MFRTIALLAATALAGACSQPASQPVTRTNVPALQPAQHSGGANQPQWRTTADGCSYSRAQAPGHAPTWHLIQNPHHLGQPPAHRGCAPTL